MDVQSSPDGRVCRIAAEEVNAELRDGKLHLAVEDLDGDSVEVVMDMLQFADLLGDAALGVVVDERPPERIAWDPQRNLVIVCSASA